MTQIRLQTLYCREPNNRWMDVHIDCWQQTEQDNICHAMWYKTGFWNSLAATQSDVDETIFLCFVDEESVIYALKQIKILRACFDMKIYIVLTVQEISLWRKGDLTTIL